MDIPFLWAHRDLTLFYSTMLVEVGRAPYQVITPRVPTNEKLNHLPRALPAQRDAPGCTLRERPISVLKLYKNFSNIPIIWDVFQIAYIVICIFCDFTKLG